MLRARWLSVLFALALPACHHDAVAPADAGPDGGPRGCTYGFLGDPTKPAEVQVLALGPGMTAVPLQDGDTVALAFPPQGGRVIFAGVRATNLDPCGATLGGAIRDETTQEVRLDTRTVNLLPGGDGWGASDPTDISTFSNVPVCPNEWSSTNLYGTEYQLELTVTDRAGRTVTQKLPVIPECSEPGERRGVPLHLPGRLRARRELRRHGRRRDGRRRDGRRRARRRRRWRSVMATRGWSLAIAGAVALAGGDGVPVARAGYGRRRQRWQ